MQTNDRIERLKGIVNGLEEVHMVLTYREQIDQDRKPLMTSALGDLVSRLAILTEQMERGFYSGT